MPPLTKKIGWASAAVFLLVALLSSVVTATDDVPQELLYENRRDASSEMMELPATAARMRGGGSANSVNVEEDTTRATTRSASFSEEEDEDTPSMYDIDSEEESSSSSTSSSSSSSDSSHDDHHNQHLRGHNDVSPLVPSWTKETHRARHLFDWCGNPCTGPSGCGGACGRCALAGLFGECVNSSPGIVSNPDPGDNRSGLGGGVVATSSCSSDLKFRCDVFSDNCLASGCGPCLYGQCTPPVVTPGIADRNGVAVVGSGCNSNFECGLFLYCNFNPYNQESRAATEFRGICHPFNGVQTCPSITCLGSERCYSVARSNGAERGPCAGGCRDGRCSGP